MQILAWFKEALLHLLHRKIVIKKKRGERQLSRLLKDGREKRKDSSNAFS